MALRGLGIAGLGQRYRVEEKRSILRPRVRYPAASDKALISHLCRWCRRRRAGCGRSPRSPWKSSPAWRPRSAVYGGAERPVIIPLSGDDEDGSTLERIAPAPLNSDRLPSMRRRWVEYTTRTDPYEKVGSFCRAVLAQVSGSIREDRVLRNCKPVYSARLESYDLGPV